MEKFVEKLIEKYKDENISMSLSINDKKCTFKVSTKNIVELNELYGLNAVKEVQDAMLIEFMRLLEKD